MVVKTKFISNIDSFEDGEDGKLIILLQLDYTDIVFKAYLNPKSAISIGKQLLEIGKECEKING